MLADGKDIDPGLIGEPGGSQDLLQPLPGADGAAIGPVRRPLSEGVEADLHQAKRCSRDPVPKSAHRR